MTIKQLADMSGVSVRTLHYYDQIGLLKPKTILENGYREYGDQGALRLQQILFFRELDFPLEQIREIMQKPEFNQLAALETHKELLGMKIERLNQLTKTIDETINMLQATSKQAAGKGKGTIMTNDDLFKGFDEKKQSQYEKEIQEKYGKTEHGARMIAQSKERVAKMGKEGMTKVQAELGEIHEEIAVNMDKGYDSPEVQAAIAKHRQWLEHFYDCSDEMHVGLGRMYVEDPRFKENYTKFLRSENGAEFMCQAIEYYNKNKN